MAQDNLRQNKGVLSCLDPLDIILKLDSKIYIKSY